METPDNFAQLRFCKTLGKGGMAWFSLSYPEQGWAHVSLTTQLTEEEKSGGKL